jgi:hypothetical protein
MVWFFLVGCAFDLAHVSFTPAQLAPEQNAKESFILTENIHITGTPCGYHRTLRRDTRWDLVGTIPEGDVYKSRDQVLTVECSNVYEAYVVVSGNTLVGFYLPVEKGFVKLSDRMQLKTR